MRANLYNNSSLVLELNALKVYSNYIGNLTCVSLPVKHYG